MKFDITTSKVLRIIGIALSLPIATFMILLWGGQLNEMGGLLVQEYIMLLFFPLIYTTGLILGWFKPKLGGVVSIYGIIAFIILEFIFNFREIEFFFLIFAIPGAFFLASDLIKERESKEQFKSACA